MGGAYNALNDSHHKQSVRGAHPTNNDHVMDIFNRDLSNPGFQDGLRHGEEGRPKDHRGSIKHAKTWAWGNDAMDSYSAAYDQGYQYGQAKAAGVFHPATATSTQLPSDSRFNPQSGEWEATAAAAAPSTESSTQTPAPANTSTPPTSTSTGDTTMSRPTSFSHQIDLLQNLKSYLAEFQERLMGVSANYQRKVDTLHQEGGMMDETYRDFVEQQLEPTRANISRLVDHIGVNDIPAVERAIAYLEQGL